MNLRAATAGAVTAFATAVLTVAGPIGPPAPQAAAVSPAHSMPAAAYAEGAPQGFSGGFGEQSCHACHFHKEINSGPERVALTGLPERFTPGERYPLTVSLSHPDMKLSGFQLTARFKDGGRQAGTVAAADDSENRIRVETQGDVRYAGHNKTGTALAEAGTARWALVWTAPEAGGAVVFHVSAVAADGDGTVEGDSVETAAIDVLPPGTAARRP